MADLVITPANVQFGSLNTRFVVAQSDVQIERGQVVAKAVTGTKYVLAKADAATTASVAGVALTNTGATGGTFIFATGGLIIPGAAGMSEGQEYYLSAATAGGICPHADLASGNFVSRVFMCNDDTNVATLQIFNSTVTI
jgi:hypothetical protein